MSRLRTKGKSTIVWLLMGLLILGLGGFGVTNFTGGSSSIGSVGDVEISDQQYTRTMQRQMQDFAARTGRNLTAAEAQSFGLQQAAVAELFATAALEDEANRLGISVGDDAVGKQLLQVQAFRGMDGKFSRDVYNDTLRREGMRPAEFEHDLRMDIARTILERAAVGGVKAPATMTDLTVNWLLETRDIRWTELTAADLPVAVVEPDQPTLEAWHQANADRFTAPEVRKIDFVWLTPEMLESSVEVDEQALRDLYQSRIDEFQQPERRMVERLVFPSSEAAAEARKRLDAGEVDFEQLAAERGLTLNDIDLGEVSQADLGAAGDAVFALTQPGIAGPADTPLGSALFSMNAILEPVNVTFEQASPDLRVEAALDRARRTIDDQSRDFADQLAGGATLQELADQTPMEFGQIDWSADIEPGPGSIGTYPAFREHAESVTETDFPEIFELGDGGIFALELKEIVAPHLIPFAEVRDRVAEDWVQNETHRQLLALADERRMKTATPETEDEAAAAEAPATETPATGAAVGPAAGGHPVANAPEAAPAETPATTQTAPQGNEAKNVARGGLVRGAPQDLVNQAFEIAAPGDVEVVDTEGRVFLVTLEKVTAATTDGADAQIVRQGVESRLSDAMRQDLLNYYTRAIQTDRKATINQTAIDAVNARVQ